MLNNFRFLTSGESHGKCLNAIIDGIPSGVQIDIDFINSELKRRQGGYGRGGRMKIETDKVEIKSGVRHGLTTGSPICLEIKNKDFENWRTIMSVEATEEYHGEKSFSEPRPGHADFAGCVKYNSKDLRDILERSSARKTAMDVAVGAVAKLILKEFGIECSSKIIELGGICSSGLTEEEFTAKVKAKIDETREIGNTLGGKFVVEYKNLPIGLGSHVQWDRKLDGEISQAVMSIPAIKSVEIGMGNDVAKILGSKVHDEFYIEDDNIKRKTNNAGGLEGGMTNGQNLVVKACMKPIPTMKTPLGTIDLKTLKETEAHFERSDVCAVSACTVVAEAAIATVLVDEFLKKFGSDNLRDIKESFQNSLKYNRGFNLD
ncbi:chorismate synthase [bacterium]|nr:chorismate synthase [bacterium]